MTVTGEVAVMLDVLGYRQGDNRILDAIALVGPNMEVEELDFDGEKSTHFIFKPSGTDFIFEDDVLVSIMIRTQPDSKDETYALYPRPTALVDGLSPTASRTEVTALLGTPERVGPNFDRYEANGRYLHFEFDSDEHVTMISTLLEPI
ncbi:hypothetical protein GCM10027271_46360 [Saccharopolyspora gloriosae]|uniref:Uncharacterized protein n=1 Tax=Saccharopolyspora gloriosae TaxID=455344 RepID=A0A840NEN0_9PSEU|nr:hypothetical protein [Saccharopolyspora gloriosae]MBB5070064.1 hypothetical protein [Saccharopolyspora gloriosae]